MISELKSKNFFEFARERYEIYLRRQRNEQRPWTKDKVLQDFYFCNVFREDDRTTIWIRENLREPMRKSEHIVFVMAVARYINRIESLDRVRDLLLNPMSNNFWETFKKRLHGVEPLVTGAYMIRSKNGFNKLDGIIQQLMPVRVKYGALCRSAVTLEDLHRALCQFEYIGGFMAYEIVTDCRHTDLLHKAPDILTWAYPGPGATRGLAHVSNEKNIRLGERKKLEMMREILKASRNKINWPENWPAWEMREVEHTLCEYDKYVRGCKGERLKRRYPK